MRCAGFLYQLNPTNKNKDRNPLGVPVLCIAALWAQIIFEVCIRLPLGDTAIFMPPYRVLPLMPNSRHLPDMRFVHFNT